MLITRYSSIMLQACICVFIASTAAWFLLVGISDLADSISLNPGRCEIKGLFKNCPLQPTLKIVRRDGIWLDNARDASKSQEVCKARAKEFYEWCHSEHPITARFFRDSNLIEQSVYPA